MAVDDAAPIGFPEVAEEKGLKTGALGGLQCGDRMASTAPAYSLAASLGFVVATANGDGIVGEGTVDHAARFHPDAAHRHCVSTVEPRGTGLRHDLHLGHSGVRAAGGVARWVGHHRRGCHRRGTSRRSRVRTRSSCSGGTDCWSPPSGRPSPAWWIVIMTYICYRGIEVSARLRCSASGHRR